MKGMGGAGGAEGGEGAEGEAPAGSATATPVNKGEDALFALCSLYDVLLSVSKVILTAAYFPAFLAMHDHL